MNSNQGFMVPAFCPAPDCGKPLRSDNTTGYCVPHRDLSPARRARREDPAVRAEAAAGQRARYAANREKMQHKAREKWRAKSVLERKWDSVRTKYKVTQEWIEAKLDEQSGLCAICEAELDLGRFTTIDHDHSCCPGPFSCGKCVRAILCSGCNAILGQARDDVARLRAAAAYLECYSRLESPGSTTEESV